MTARQPGDLDSPWAAELAVYDVMRARLPPGRLRALLIHLRDTEQAVQELRDACDEAHVECADMERQRNDVRALLSAAREVVKRLRERNAEMEALVAELEAR